MALNIEWKRRIEWWRGELRNHLYRPLADLDLEGFVTRERLTPQQAQEGRFGPMPVGTRWGAKWEYGWFRASTVTPREGARRRVALCLDAGGEALVYVNGTAAGARDQQHEHITLARQGRPGDRWAILAEAYAGHGPMVVHAGPVPPGRQTVPEPGPTQREVGRSSIGIWEEEVYQLLMDVQTLFLLRECLDENSLRVSQIDEGLRDLTSIVDFEQPLEGMLASVERCRRRLAPLLACKNGSTAPTLWAFGHAHIDLAWLWPLAETERKAARTFSTQLALFAEYPEFRFLQSTPQLYQMVKDLYPDLYKRVKAAVKEGRIIPEGGMWVESDTNVPCGESLIRQFLHGQRFFREEFGVENEMLWLPDVFGYSGALPQILRGCGIKYFSTAKIFWAYNGGEPFPYNTFRWEGIDGSTVLAHFTNDYNSHTDPASIIQRWNERVQKDGITERLLPFGFGDGGGGPTRDHLEYTRRMADLEGAPRVKPGHPVEFFRRAEKNGRDLPRYVGELYFQAHRGTYTSQARTKRANRKSEVALREAEHWASAARALEGVRAPAEKLDAAWKLLLLNQFHDILPGSSIARVYEDALAAHAEVQRAAAEVTTASTSALTGGREGKGLTVFNSLSWERSALVELPGAVAPVTDGEGRELPQQVVGGKGLVELRIPSCGWTSLNLGDGARASPRTPPSAGTTVRASRRSLSNERMSFTFNDHGEVESIRDKEADRELAAGPCNRLRMYRDVPGSWDAWDIDSMYSLTPVELDQRATIEVLDEGPLVARLRITRRINESDLTQIVSLRRGSRRLDFQTSVEWRESHKMLKVAFPLALRSDQALHEIQFGHLRRPTHLSRQFDADRFEVCAHRWSAVAEEARGVAVLNDCKYGVNVLEGSINLTLLKSALAPDMSADKGRQEFTYALYSWNGSLFESGLVREGYELNCPVVTCGGSAGEKSLLRVNSPNIIVETVKPGEAADLIAVRLYESARTATRCSLTIDLPVEAVQEADLRERANRDLELRERRVSLDFRPFEVKTLLLRLGPSTAREAPARKTAARPKRGIRA